MNLETSGSRLLYNSSITRPVREKLEQLFNVLDEDLESLSLVWLSGAATACAQNTPELREVLARLDRLENDNRALTDEIRALRKELALLHVRRMWLKRGHPRRALRSNRRVTGGKRTRNARSNRAALKSWRRPKSSLLKNFRSVSPGWLYSTLT